MKNSGDITMKKREKRYGYVLFRNLILILLMMLSLPQLQAETLEASAPVAFTPGVDNRMKADVCNDEDEDSASGAEVFQTGIQRNTVYSVTFLDTIKDAPKENAYDISELGNGTVLLWSEQRENGLYDLYVAGQGGVSAPDHCRGLFNGYRSMVSIQFNNAFHTENTKDMALMFRHCRSLTKLDLSSFNTADVRDMDSMFHSCENLVVLELSNFKPPMYII